MSWRLTGQTLVPLSGIVPGTEKVQLVNNGDFQLQGSVVNNEHPFPAGWTRAGDMFAGSGINLVPNDSSVVARANVDGSAPVSLYQQVIYLEPNADYVLSGYLWNMGDAPNHVTTVIDLNDVFNEPQITLNYSDPNADQGYFVYRSFNTADTSPTVTLRAFYDGFTGVGASATYYPIGAQWDNLAITKAADFVPPLSVGSVGNLRPLVRILSPTNGSSLSLLGSPPALQVTASASDPDGGIARIEFFANATKLGEVTSAPDTIGWSNVFSGGYQLTAVATDNQGATTVSAPVLITVSIVPQPVTLGIAQIGAAVLLSWPSSVSAASLQGVFNLSTTNAWRSVTNAVADSNLVTSTRIANAATQAFFRLAREVDPSTLNRKLLMGYQGWFACPQDGSLPNRWVHWFRSQTPAATNATVDFWPDISELDADELFSTTMTLGNGNPAKLYSAFKQKTVVRHFKWMKDNHLDGVFLQRFSSELADPVFFALRNQVLENVKAGAETYGRVFALMYDISGQPASTLLRTLTNDWSYLVHTLHVTNSPQYVRHKGKPVVAIWGFGFTDRPGTPADAQWLINYFKAAGLTVMGGVPTYWRTLNNDSQTNAAWASVYRSFDVLSPWMVGRFSTLAQADSFTNLFAADLADTKTHNMEYMPVIFPGFSWHNLNGGPLNQIPRLGGSFYWRQVYNVLNVGCTMVYGAMFDEMDEGTAMLKMAPSTNELPAQGTFVPLNIDGQSLPNDWYLRLAKEASKMLRQEIPLQSQLPITPQ